MNERVNPFVNTTVNRNLLDNAYFVNPVNQRGLATYTTTAEAYTIDRWKTANAKLEILSDGVQFSSETAAGAHYIEQRAEASRLMEDQDYTLSILYVGTDSNIHLTSVTGKSTASFNYVTVMSNAGSTGLQLQLRRDAGDTCIRVLVRMDSVAIQPVKFIAAKLEHGSTQTLARLEDGKWVLNEVPDYNTELQKCMVYFERVNMAMGTIWPVYRKDEASNTIPYTVVKRAVPTITLYTYYLVVTAGNGGVYGAQVAHQPKIERVTNRECRIYFNEPVVTLEVGTSTYISTSSQTKITYFDVSADL